MRRANVSIAKAAYKAPFLGRDEEFILTIAWKEQHDERALHRMIAAHMRLVLAVAARFRHFGLPMGDLVQEGHIGLLEAAFRFDPRREVRFSTYATWWIRAAMQDFTLRNWSIVRGGTSSTQKALFFKLRRLRAKLQSANPDATTDEIHLMIANELHVSASDVAAMESRLSAHDSSLNQPASADGDMAMEWIDLIADDKPLLDAQVEALIDENLLRQWLMDALECLDKRERTIVERRRLCEQAITLQELGAALDISKERVRQIENRAIEKIRARMLRDHPASQSYFS